MNRERYPIYQPYTWNIVLARLLELTEPELQQLALRAQIDMSESETDLIGSLLYKGGFLLVEFGLINDPEATRGAVFDYDIHEYVLHNDAAKQLAAGEDVTVRYVGGDFAGVLTAEEVVTALKTSEVFDQLERV